MWTGHTSSTRRPIHAPMTHDFRDRGLIINERLEEYDGTSGGEDRACVGGRGRVHALAKPTAG